MTDLVQQPFKGHEVLPLNSTPMERAMADVSADFLLNLDIPIHKLWNPWECPEPYLPYLAWALSVDVWDNSWETLVKRRVIAASPMIHRRKGTRWAVEEALKSIGLSAKITEWWQNYPEKRRGTFEVTALINEQIYNGGAVIDEKMQELAHEMIKSSKPKSRVFSLKLGVGFYQASAISTASSAPLQISRNTAAADFKVAPYNAVAALNATSGLNIVRSTARCTQQKSIYSVPSAAVAASSIQILKFKAELI